VSLRTCVPIDGIPGGTFVLEIVATVTVVGAQYAHTRHQRDQTFEVDRAVATYAFGALIFAAGVQVLLVALP
jgi:hypothetical protein